MTRASWEAIEWWKFTEFSSEHPRGGYSCWLFPGQIEIWNVGFCRRMKTGGPGENPRSNDEYQYTTQPTWNATSRNRMHATTVGGERSRHCTIPAISHFLWNLLKDSSILKFSKAILGPRLTSLLKSNVTPVVINLITRNMLTFPVLLSILTFRGAPRLSAVSEIKTRKKDGLKQLHKCHKKVRSGFGTETWPSHLRCFRG